MILKLISGVVLLSLMHISIWWATNTQLLEGYSYKKSLAYAVGLSIPISLFSFYATRVLYSAAHESLWAVRFIAFGVSYLVFPIMTWYFLGESMFTLKTLACIFLSIIIILIQIFL